MRYTMPRSLPLMWTPRPFRRSAKCSSLICGISVVVFWALWERVTWSILSVLHCMVTSYKAIKCYKYVHIFTLYGSIINYIGYYIDLYRYKNQLMYFTVCFRYAATRQKSFRGITCGGKATSLARATAGSCAAQLENLGKGRLGMIV